MSERNLQLPSLHLTYQFSSGTASSNRAKHPPPPAKPELRQRNSDRCMEFVLQCGTGPCCQATTGVKSRGPLHRIQGRTTNHGFGLFKGDLAQTIPPWIRRLDIFLVPQFALGIAWKFKWFSHYIFLTSRRKRPFPVVPI